MAIYLEDGVLSWDDEEWKDRYINNDEGTATIKVSIDDDNNLVFTEEDEPESNPALTDTVTHKQHYLGISKDVLYLTDSSDSVGDGVFQCLCNKLDELINLQKEAADSTGGFIAVR